jgi:hypothetical protein
MAAGDLLVHAVTELYAVAPADFVARRTALAKAARAAGDREAAQEITALRKPTVSADAVNRVVRSGDPVVRRLRDVGTRMRHAQSALDAAGLAELRGPRDEVIRAFAAAAETVAGVSSAAAQAEVRDTVIAALADAAAEAVVCSGALTRALHYSGFGEVDRSDAVARTSTGVVLTRIEGGGGDADQPEESEGAGSAMDEEEPQPRALPEEAPAADTPDGPDPEILAMARAAVDRAERELRRTQAEVDQASRLLTQARRRAEAAEAAHEAALADLAELAPDETQSPGQHSDS